MLADRDRLLKGFEDGRMPTAELVSPGFQPEPLPFGTRLDGIPVLRYS
jgi:hypothetical protein